MKRFWQSIQGDFIDIRRMAEGTALRVGASAALLAGWTALAAAQVGSGAITGTVRDQTGRVVPGATVRAREAESGGVRSAISGSAGVFALPSLRPGVYAVSAELSGFRTLTREGVRIETGQNVRLDFELALGGVEEALTIAADSPLLRRESASLGTVIDERRVTALPLERPQPSSRSRRWRPASRCRRVRCCRASTAAGRAPTSICSTASRCCSPSRGRWRSSRCPTRFRSSRSRATARRPSSGGSTAASSISSPRSGGNSPRGTALRVLPARAPERARTSSHRPTRRGPRFRRDQFGGVIGGPLRRDRTFFFVDYQQQRQTHRPDGHLHRPDAAAAAGPLHGGHRRTGADRLRPGHDRGLGRQPFPGNVIPQARLDPVALALLARYPLPTSDGTANNYRRTGNEVGGPASVRRPDRPPGEGRTRRALRPRLALPGAVRAGHAVAGRQRRHRRGRRARRTPVRGRWRAPIGASSAIGGSTNCGRVTPAGPWRRTGATLPGTACETLGLPGIPTGGRFASALPTFQIAGYQQLGSPAEHRHRLRHARHPTGGHAVLAARTAHGEDRVRLSAGRS